MRTLVVAPHADDELLGCGGTLLRRRSEGAIVGWLLVTAMDASRWGNDRIEKRRSEILSVREGLDINAEHLFELGLPTTQLDRIPMDELVERISTTFGQFQPEEVLVPHASDIHSDHRAVFDAVASCTKWFRYPSIRRVLAYETVSETDFILKPESLFRPNYYVNVASQLERKIELMKIYRSELGQHPFPRSETTLRALAQLRGAQSGFAAAEAFMLLRERV